MATRGIANKGLRGMRRFAARFNFSRNLTENQAQSATFHNAKRSN
jgi:hypothetical protein